MERIEIIVNKPTWEEACNARIPSVYLNESSFSFMSPVETHYVLEFQQDQIEIYPDESVISQLVRACFRSFAVEGAKWLLKTPFRWHGGIHQIDDTFKIFSRVHNILGGKVYGKYEGYATPEGDQKLPEYEVKLIHGKNYVFSTSLIADLASKLSKDCELGELDKITYNCVPIKYKDRSGYPQEKLTFIDGYRDRQIRRFITNGWLLSRTGPYLWNEDVIEKAVTRFKEKKNPRSWVWNLLHS